MIGGLNSEHHAVLRGSVLAGTVVTKLSGVNSNQLVFFVVSPRSAVFMLVCIYARC